MTDFDTLIVNGTLIDGAGGPQRVADVGILDGKVAAVGRLTNSSAETVIDAAGKIVAPGHVTQHAHYDAALFWDPYCMDSGEHGVTTILNANCGFSIAPVHESDRERTMAMLATTEQIPVEQQRIGMPWNWESFPEFIERLEALPKGVNILTYLPVNPLLIYVMGVVGAKTRRPTKEEMDEMHRLINEAMDLGAVGISMSVMGLEGNSHLDFDGTAMPTDSLHDDDIVELARALADRGEGIVQVLSQIGPNGNKEIARKIGRMAKGTGVRVLHNIFLAVDGVPEMIDADLAWLDEMREEGFDVTAGTLLHCGWVESGIQDLDTAAGQMAAVRKIIACNSDDEIRALLNSKTFVTEFSDEYARDGATTGAGGFEGQIVIDIGDEPDLQNYLGKSLQEIANDSGQSVVEVLCDLAIRSDLALQIKSAPFAAVDGTLGARLLAHNAVAGGVSDGGAHTKSFSSGCYATEMIIRMVREQKAMTLEEMHYQLSLKVARLLNIPDRGALLRGFWADIVIYDLDALYIDRSRHKIVNDMPGGDWRRVIDSGGYSQILVNGVSTFVDGKPTGSTPGELTRVYGDNSQEYAVAAE